MQEQVSLLISAARRRIKQAVVARVTQHRLKPHQFWILVSLMESPGISQAALAERVRADAPTISRAISTLAERRLVRTESDPADRRRTRVFLTATGDRLAGELFPVARQIREAIEAGMSATDVAALRDGLRRVLANLDSLHGGTPPRDRR